MENVFVTIEEDTEPNPDFPNEDMREVGKYLGWMLCSLLENETVNIHCEQDRKGLRFHVALGNDESNRLLIGPKFRVVNAVLEILRFQQLFKHNRFIELILYKEDGTTQSIFNRRVSH